MPHHNLRAKLLAERIPRKIECNIDAYFLNESARRSGPAITKNAFISY